MVQTLIGGKTSTSDDCGNYGYSGQESNTLLTDSETNWIPQLKTAGYVPDVIIYTGLVVNDIAAGASVATIKKRLQSVLRTHKARFPGLIQVVPTPHPDFRVNTTALKAVFLSIRDYILSLNNNFDLITPDLSGAGSYANPSDLTQSLPYYGYQTVIGTTDSLGDMYGVHPNNLGAVINARLFANALRNAIRFGLPSLARQYYSVNPTLGGSVALSVNGSGTVPTGFTQTLALGSGASCVADASGVDPFNVIVKAATVISGTSSGKFTFQASGAISGLGAVASGCIQKVRINSGSRALCGVFGTSISNEATNGNLTDRGGAAVNSNDFYADFTGGPSGYKDGDVLWLVSPLRTRAVTPLTMFHQVNFCSGPSSAVNADILQAGLITP